MFNCFNYVAYDGVTSQGDVRRQGPRIEANRKELNFILILCGGGQVIIIVFNILICF